MFDKFNQKERYIANVLSASSLVLDNYERTYALCCSF